MSEAGPAREASEPGTSANVAMRLRALARDHQEGRLSRDAYRKLRAPLIDALDSSVDSQSNTIPNLESRTRAARATAVAPALPVTPESEAATTTTTTAQEARRSRLARMLAWATSVLRR
jgi:hypothetical protein